MPTLTVVRGLSLAGIAIAAILLLRVLPLDRLIGIAQVWIDGLGAIGPVALGVIYVVAALLFVPGSLLTLAAGAIYGLVLGTIIVSIAATTSAALAFLIARYAARDRVRRVVAQSPRLAAVDRAIGAEGWKIVALLRLSPAVPFNLQNYLYGVTAVRFWPAVGASWLAMLPGTFMFVYLGSIGRTAASGAATTPVEWALRAIGLAATVAVTVYVARLARRAIAERTSIEDDAGDDAGRPASAGAPQGAGAARTLVLAACAASLLALAIWALVHEREVRGTVERLLGLPPAATAAPS
ncbi:TVP38/TMEM64 family protein [Luteitalea sp.]